MRFAVCVNFKIKSGFEQEFLSLVNANAKNSLSLEDGCLIFDVCTNTKQLDEVFLYEIYSSKEEFDIHLKSEHFLQFDKEVAHMISDKQVKTYTTVV